MNFLDRRLPDRFWSKCIPEPMSGCWLWTANTDAGGYARIRMNGAMASAHRAAYEVLVAQIPDGLEIDHRCRVRCCVNPTHMEPVTHAENVRRGVLVEITRDRFASQTHCKKGHAFDEENTYVCGDGWRKCKVCTRDRKYRQYHRENPDAQYMRRRKAS